MQRKVLENLIRSLKTLLVLLCLVEFLCMFRILYLFLDDQARPQKWNKVDGKYKHSDQNLFEDSSFLGRQNLRFLKDLVMHHYKTPAADMRWKRGRLLATVCYSYQKRVL